MFDSCNKYTNVYATVYNLSWFTRDIIYLSMYERMNEWINERGKDGWMYGWKEGRKEGML